MITRDTPMPVGGGLMMLTGTLDTKGERVYPLLPKTCHIKSCTVYGSDMAEIELNTPCSGTVTLRVYDARKCWYECIYAGM